MAATARATPVRQPHIPVLLGPLLRRRGARSRALARRHLRRGRLYARASRRGGDEVIGVDRDPLAFDMARDWAGAYGDRMTLVEGTFSRPRRHADGPLDGVVLDLGVSSMQLDQAERGFSFMKDGPLGHADERSGPSAADIVNRRPRKPIADILYHYGEERASAASPGHRQGARRGARSPARATGEDRRRLPAAPEARSEPPRDPHLPGAADRGERRIRRTVAGLEAAERALKPGRAAGRGELPFARGPDGQAVPPAPLGHRRGAAAAMRPRRPRRRRASRR
jgi:16S rRNA (cytosine1402-N4)-methyltransferase